MCEECGGRRITVQWENESAQGSPAGNVSKTLGCRLESNPDVLEVVNAATRVSAEAREHKSSSPEGWLV